MRASVRIDAHAHLAPDPEALARLLSMLDATRMDLAVVVGGGLVRPDELAAGAPPSSGREARCDHAALLTLCDSAGGRLLPFHFANPWDPPTKYRDRGHRFYGLKLGPAVHGSPFLSPETRAYVEVAAELGHPVYLHCLDRPGLRVADLVALAEAYPEVCFILGHGGVGQLDFGCIDRIEPRGNILYETSGAFLAPVRRACERLGAHRVLYGSEHPLQSGRAELAKIEDLNLSEPELAQVLGGNLHRLLGLRVPAEAAAC